MSTAFSCTLLALFFIAETCWVAWLEASLLISSAAFFAWFGWEGVLTLRGAPSVTFTGVASGISVWPSISVSNVGRLFWIEASSLPADTSNAPPRPGRVVTNSLALALLTRSTVFRGVSALVKSMPGRALAILDGAGDGALISGCEPEVGMSLMGRGATCFPSWALGSCPNILLLFAPTGTPASTVGPGTSIWAFISAGISSPPSCPCSGRPVLLSMRGAFRFLMGRCTMALLNNGENRPK